MTTDTEEKEQDKAAQLPKPTGYKILCMVPGVEDKFESGILKADTTRAIEETSTVTLFVMQLGPDCYQDRTKFPNGPWCKEGDFIMTRAYSGTRFKIHGREFRLINDDTVEAVVQDPRGITRA